MQTGSRSRLLFDSKAIRHFLSIIFTKLEIIFQAEIASRGWHVYGKSVWKNPKKTGNLTAEKRN